MPLIYNRRMASPSRFALLFSVGLVALSAGCDCAGPPGATGGPGSPCMSTSQCQSGLVCRDAVCTRTGGPDGGPHDAGPMTDTATCPTESRCLMGLLCCGAGEECVDDFTCAPVCAN